MRKTKKPGTATMSDDLNSSTAWSAYLEMRNMSREQYFEERRQQILRKVKAREAVDD